MLNTNGLARARAFPLSRSDRRQRAINLARTYIRTRSWPDDGTEMDVLETILDDAPGYRLKRVLDLTVAIPALVVSLPLVGLLAAAIRIESPGNPFFVQERLGYLKHSFRIWKLRTMYAGSDDPRRLTQRGDSRITPLGRTLRKLRLDELPQLWNVIKGDMSLVGPRPFRKAYAQKIAAQVPFYDLRYTELPGLTGLAQVAYRYPESDEDQIEKFKWELRYLERRSLLYDFKILLRTVAVVLGRNGV